MRLTENFSSGFALTIDSFCAGGNIKNALIKYTYINKVVAYDESDILNFLHYSIKINGEYKYESGKSILSDDIYSNEEYYLFGTDLKYYEISAL